MFPYRDENETQRTAIVTGTIIGLNVLSWIVVQGPATQYRWSSLSASSGFMHPSDGIMGNRSTTHYFWRKWRERF